MKKRIKIATVSLAFLFVVYILFIVIFARIPGNVAGIGDYCLSSPESSFVISIWIEESEFTASEPDGIYAGFFTRNKYLEAIYAPFFEANAFKEGGSPTFVARWIFGINFSRAERIDALAAPHPIDLPITGSDPEEHMAVGTEP